jgi:molybdopterin molybdotransferase
MTGAMIPEGSDAVVRVEDTAEHDGTVDVRVPVAAGTSLRGAGSDLRRGDLLATAGRVVTPGLIGVLASAGHVAVHCIRRPRVLVLTTGDELREPGEVLGPGQITNTNRYTLLAAVQDAGGIVVDAGVARDERGDLIERLSAAGDTDLVVTTGGVSMGAYDLVRGLLEEREAVTFWQVALRPGKPLMFATLGSVPLIGLPGNPVSTLVAFELFVRPALLKLQGRTDLERPRLTAITEEPLQNPPHLEQYFRGIARHDGARIVVRLTGDQGSHVLRSMADANCLIVVPLGTSQIRAGDPPAGADLLTAPRLRYLLAEGRRWGESTRNASVTLPYSAIATTAKRAWPKRCSTPVARSIGWGVRTRATPPSTSSRKRSSGRSRSAPPSRT